MKNIFLIFLNKYKYHFLVWSIFIAYETIMQKLTGLKVLSIKEYIIIYSLNVFIFYFHAHVVLKHTLNNKNKLLKYILPLLIVLEIICYIIFKYLIEKFYRYIGVLPPEIGSLKIYIGMKVWRCIYFIGISTVYYFLIRDLQQKKKIEKMRQQELKAVLLEEDIKNELVLTQNALLRSQINPHFLINTLSYLYNETRKPAPMAAESILSLSDILQYSLSKEISSEYVKLENEIKLLESYLVLHRAKQTSQIHLTLSYNNEALSVYFIPLILMTLIETMIKYGEPDNLRKPAEIKITYQNSILQIDTAHFEVIANPLSAHDTCLKNISNRLFLAYRERVIFDFSLDSQNYFHTSIKVQF